MTRTSQRPRVVALASVAAVGLLTVVMAVAMVVLVVTDPVRTADALSARDAGPMISALASLIWKALDAVLAYL
jgi:hypothetical protein